MICGVRTEIQEPCGQMRDEKLHAVWHEAHFQVKMYKTPHIRTTFGSAVVMSKKCTPLWREAHFQVKMYKTQHVRTTFGSWDVEKVHAAVARSTFPSQNVQGTPVLRTHFGSWDVEKVHAKHAKNITCPDTLLDVQMSFRVAGAPCQKWAKRAGLLAFPKTMAGIGHLKRICKGACCMAGAVQETCSSDMLAKRQGADILREVTLWSITSSGYTKMILRDRCGTSYDLASLFRGRRSTLDRWSGKIAKTHWYEAVSSALNFPCLKEVTQNCFVFDVANFKNWGNLAEYIVVVLRY